MNERKYADPPGMPESERMTPADPRMATPALPEFDVVEHGDGTYAATHRGTGETVTARTWESLVNKAAATGGER